MTREESASAYPPWWQTMEADPWYITVGKALLGEREVEGLRRGDPMARWEVLSPLLFMGKGGPKGKVLDMLGGARPQVPPPRGMDVMPIPSQPPLSMAQRGLILEGQIPPSIKPTSGLEDFKKFIQKLPENTALPEPPPRGYGSGVIDNETWLRYQLYQKLGGHLPLEQWLKNPLTPPGVKPPENVLPEYKDNIPFNWMKKEPPGGFTEDFSAAGRQAGSYGIEPPSFEGLYPGVRWNPDTMRWELPGRGTLGPLEAEPPAGEMQLPPPPRLQPSPPPFRPPGDSSEPPSGYPPWWLTQNQGMQQPAYA
jgi:hypothetical protein